jgi:nitrogen fixation NifU-like protein
VSDSLHHEAILDLGRGAHGAGRLADPTVSVTLHNALCGDRVTVDLVLADGKVGAIGHRVRGCALCEASASAIGLHAVGATSIELRRAGAEMAALIAGEDVDPAWPELLAFVPVRDFKSRHRCVLLPFEAVTEALGKAGVE